MSGENKNDGLIYFGPSHLNYLPYGAINELPQVRVKYEGSALGELADAMVADPTLKKQSREVTSEDFDMLKPVTVGRHDKSSARRYINDHGEFYGIAKAARVHPSDLVPMDDGTNVISIAGHRRKRAIKLLMGRFNVDLGIVRVAADERRNISFVEAQGLQLRENVYDRPPVQDEARAIDLFYRDITRQNGGVPPLISQFASQLGFGETKVRDALAFASLPDTIQDYTRDGLLPYSTVRRLRVLADAFTRFHAHLEPEVGAKNVEHDLVVFCNGMLTMNLQGNTEDSRARLIENKAKEIFGQADYQQDALLYLDFATPRARRQTSSDQLAKLAFSVLKHQIRQGELSAASLAEIQEAIDEVNSLAKSSVTLFDDLNAARDVS